MAGRVEVIDGKGCSNLFSGHTYSLRSMRGLQSEMPPSSSSVVSQPVIRARGPFSGLVICVTGLSKEARKQVMDASVRLGGQYSPNLHHQCTHLVVQSFGGRKFEHALKYGSKKGLFVVTLGWFVDSVRKNVRLSESLYIVKNVGRNGMHADHTVQLHGLNGAENSCLPFDLREDAKLSNTINEHQPQISGRKSKISMESTLSGHTMYVDLDISDELRSKVIQAAAREGVTFVDQWFAGSHSDYVVCEEPSIHRYLGHSNNLVTPLWVLKTAKEKNVQRLVHMSADLARKVGTVLVDFQDGNTREEAIGEDGPQVSLQLKSKSSLEERRKIVNLAKIGVRSRRECRMQTCQTPIRPITPSSILDSIIWSISEPTSTASIYTDDLIVDDVSQQHKSVLFDAKFDCTEQEASFTSSLRLLTESEKAKLVFKNHFLTILFPIDRFGEMGPSSRTFFSEKGFTCLQVLDHIHAFYQENMSVPEIETAIHTDSRHADSLRSAYSSTETAELGFVKFKRVDFLGSRRSFEMLKRVGGDNNNNVYELLIRA